MGQRRGRTLSVNCRTSHAAQEIAPNDVLYLAPLTLGGVPIRRVDAAPRRDPEINRGGTMSSLRRP